MATVNLDARLAQHKAVIHSLPFPLSFLPPSLRWIGMRQIRATLAAAPLSTVICNLGMITDLSWTTLQSRGMFLMTQVHTWPAAGSCDSWTTSPKLIYIARSRCNEVIVVPVLAMPPFQVFLDWNSFCGTELYTLTTLQLNAYDSCLVESCSQ